MSEDKKHITPKFSEQEIDSALDLLSQLRVPQGNKTKADAWDSLFSSIDDTQADEIVSSPAIKRLWRIAVAASVVVLLGMASFLYFASNVSLSAGEAEHLATLLPDGSNVTLNAGSTISYRRYGWHSNRNVSLTGEAMFSVKKGKTFTVEVNGYSVQVLGTVFNVRYRDSLLDVKCYEGVVAVSQGADNPVVVTAGQSVSVTKGSAIPSPTPLTESVESNWTTGDFYFDKSPLPHVFAEIERQFGVSIQPANDIASRTYSGYFSKSSLPVALEMVCVPMGLSWSITADSTIVLVNPQDTLQ